MSTDPGSNEDLDRALAALPRSLAPPHDLWPAIEAAIEAPVRRPRSLSWPVALAAGLALIALTALVTDLAVNARRPAVELAATASPSSSAKLAATRRDLQVAFEQRLALLAPATRAAVQHSLATIQQAQRELDEALAKDPSSPLVHDLLDATWQQEYALYQDVVRGTDPFAQRT